MRDEFPSLRAAGAHLPAVASEPILWAFVAGVGAGPIASGIVRVLLLVLAPALFPATEPRPEWLTPGILATGAAGLASGIVLVRAGGPAALGAFVGYELLRALAALPGRVDFCARTSLPRGDLFSASRGCDYTALVIERWPTWLALALGAVVGLWLGRGAPGVNRLFRAAGLFALVLAFFSTAVSLGSPNVATDRQIPLLVLFTFGNVVAGIAAGIALATDRLASAVLLAVLIMAPGVALALPLALRNAQGPEPIETTLLRWSGVVIPLAAAAVVLGARAYVRGREVPGTFS